MNKEFIIRFGITVAAVLAAGAIRDYLNTRRTP
jgi:hypothetical protein